MNGPQHSVREIRGISQSRRDVLVDSMARSGWDIPSPPASMFAWSPIPEKFRHLGSMGFATLLLEQAVFAVAPGIGFGEYGDGHVRIGLVENEQRIRQAARNVKRMMAHADQIVAEYEERIGIKGSVVPHPSSTRAGRT